MEEYAHLRQRLEQMKNDISHRLNETDDFGLAHGFASSVASGEMSQYDNHPADSATALYEREKDIALHEHAVMELEDIEHALNKFENGSYGICEKTGKKIPIERLEAIPTARTVIEETKIYENFSRPVEEEVLGGFKQFNFDEADDQTQFDAEDSWQAVAKFNELPMVYEDSSVHESGELVGYVEEIEGFLSTDIEGFTGTDNVQFQRNVHYDQYLNDK